MDSSNGAENPVPQRPKLNLKPRDPNAVARLEAERLQAAAKSPFGAAKPRELVIASREGKTEEDILKEEVKKEKLHLRLNASQLEEKRAHEAAVKEIEDQIEVEEDAAKKEVLRVELTAREAKLNSLMERFAKVTLEAAMSGEAPRVSQLRRQQMEAAAVAGGPGAAPYGPAAAGAGGPPGQYNQRYNPTQQYAGPAQRGGYNAGGYGGYGQRGAQYEHYNAGGRGYVPRGGGRGGRGGGRGGGGALPEWATEDYGGGAGTGGGYRGGGAAGGGGYRTGSGYTDPVAAYRPAPGGGYGDTSDAGFFDQPGGYSGGGGGGGGRGRGRGRGGRGGGGGGGAGYYDAFTPGPAAYGGGGGRGVGGEIDFETFSGQDRY